MVIGSKLWHNGEDGWLCFFLSGREVFVDVVHDLSPEELLLRSISIDRGSKRVTVSLQYFVC